MMLHRIGSTAFVAAILSASTTNAGTPAKKDLFDSEKTVLSFTASLGPKWREVNGRQYCCEVEGLRITRYEFRWTKNTGLVQIGVDAEGRPRLYELRYPIVDNVCLEIPDTRTLARKLLENAEPAFADDERNINRLGGRADLVWPWTAFPSGPPTQFGKTQFFFLKMMGIALYE